MGLCGSVDDKTKNDESQSDEAHAKPDTRAKIDTVVVNWNMAGINENAYVVNMAAYFFFSLPKGVKDKNTHTHSHHKQSGISTGIDKKIGERREEHGLGIRGDVVFFDRACCDWFSIRYRKFKSIYEENSGFDNRSSL